VPLVADSGSVVVMEARTGRIVAMASYPSYDPAVFLGGVSTEEYAALVDESAGRRWCSGRSRARTRRPRRSSRSRWRRRCRAATTRCAGRYACPGVYAPTGQTNFDAAPLGVVDLREALVKSCDTVFYAFGYEQWQRDGGARRWPSRRTR
jgi:penicillin-binding protein 2